MAAAFSWEARALGFLWGISDRYGINLVLPRWTGLAISLLGAWFMFSSPRRVLGTVATRLVAALVSP
ncbi:hypothetical protein CSW47_02465 [Thermus scotoductus]|uniref:Uncharacterized protein n=1 Tax=Thermus scotoductus TaxID=37636 RepID=A0A430RG87_THESC|nr:hypothetical protein CSW47_02465 [Thermus scotoductus]